MADSPRHYLWQNFNCTYTVRGLSNSSNRTPAIVLIHPIGVGLSKAFWQPFVAAWLQQSPNSVVYNPALLGCGDSDMPAVAYSALDWAKQLKYFVENIVKQPVILTVQGASFSIAIELTKIISDPQLIRGLVLAAPPAWSTMTKAANPLVQKLLWNLLFDSPFGLGQLFYLYARRRQFLASFSQRQLFAEAESFSDRWLDTLIVGSANLSSRYAVFSFLAGFWRDDYTLDIAEIKQPTLVVFGEKSSSISREGLTETLQDRQNLYLKQLSQGQVTVIEGRNVLPIESTSRFVEVVHDFWQKLPANSRDF